MLSGCDIYWEITWNADKDKTGIRLDRLEVNQSEDNL